MTSRLVVFWLAVGLCTAFLAGQNSKVDLKADEATIRALAENAMSLPHTEDFVFWSAAYKRPSVGSQRGELLPESAAERRRNEKSTWKVERIEVAAAGDMAWEFSYGTLDYDLDTTPSRHVSTERATLRVWKKVDGKWKVAAAFRRPLDRDFVPLSPK